jgi:hypothetical protein
LFQRDSIVWMRDCCYKQNEHFKSYCKAIQVSKVALMESDVVHFA